MQRGGEKRDTILIKDPDRVCQIPFIFHFAWDKQQRVYTIIAMVLNVFTQDSGNFNFI